MKLKFCFFWEKLKTTCVMMDLDYLIKFVEVVEIIWVLLPKFDQKFYSEWWVTRLIEFHTTNSFMTKCRSCQLIVLIFSFFLFFNAPPPHHDPWIHSKVSCSVKHRILKILIVPPPPVHTKLTQNGTGKELMASTVELWHLTEMLFDNHKKEI